MKIAVFHNLPPGGAKRVLYEEIKILSRAHELHLFELTLTDKNFLDIRLFFKKVHCFFFKIDSKLPGFLARLGRDYRNFFLLLQVQRKIAHEINQGNFDVCLVHPDRFTQAPFILRYLEVPSVYFCEELLRLAYEEELRFKENDFFLKIWYENVTRLLRKKIDRKNARLATRILANSFYIKEKVKEAYGVNSDVCHLGVDSGVFKPVGRRKRDQILFIGRKDRVSGLDLFERLRGLVNENHEINFKQIIFSGKFSDEDLVKEYCRSILTLCTSYNEPFGLVALESMACETPVLAVNEGGYRETIEDGKTGFLLRRDPREFLEKIFFIIENPLIARKLGEEGRRYVVERWRWDRHVDCLEWHLNEVSGSKKERF